ncbi:hypothetical protein ACHWQZ_G019043 [Mnemiopsis leidyi]
MFLLSCCCGEPHTAIVETKKLTHQNKRSSRANGNSDKKRNSSNHWNRSVNEIRSRRSRRRSGLEDGEDYPIYTRHSIVDAPKLKELLKEQAMIAEPRRLARADSVVINGFVMSRKPREILTSQNSLTQVVPDETDECSAGQLENGSYPEIKITKSGVILETEDCNNKTTAETLTREAEGDYNCLPKEESQVVEDGEINSANLDSSKLTEEKKHHDTDPLSQIVFTSGSLEKSTKLWVETHDFETCPTDDSKDYCPIRSLSEDLGRKPRRSKSLFKFTKNSKTKRSKSCSSEIKTEKTNKKKSKQ